jgi:hypothetical protein
MLGDVPLESVQDVCDRVELCNLLEKLPAAVTFRSMREVGKGSPASDHAGQFIRNPDQAHHLRPRHDRYQRDADDHGTLHFESHEIRGDDPSAKDANPHLGIFRLVLACMIRAGAF